MNYFDEPFEAEMGRFTQPDKRGIYPSYVEWDLKREAPYSYPPFYRWQQNRRGLKLDSATEYSDRLVTRDYDRYNEVCREVWGNAGQYFDERAPEKIEEFLEKYLDLRRVYLFEIVEHCNMATGFPCWSFGFYYEK